MPLNFSNNYQYNYKEWNDDLGLYLNDYGFRYFNPQLNQWHSIDPLAENYYALSSYTYVANNPIKYTDPDGRYIPELEANPSEAMYKLLAEIDKDGDDCPECLPGTMLNTVTVTDYRVWDFMKDDKKREEEDRMFAILEAMKEVPEEVRFVPASGAITEDYILLDLLFGVEDLALKGAAKFAVVPIIVKGMGKGSARLWTSTKNLSSVKNAFAHWKKHGAEFPEFLNAKQYV